jgi:uncharacterized protein YdcH (DUF465 family)
MTHITHDLHHEFPAHADALHRLKMTDPHFKRLSHEYDEINQSIYKAEAGLAAMDDLALETLKKKRLSLKDEIATLLKD